MASYQISQPDKFNFGEQDKWLARICQFQCFSQASGLIKKGEESQVNALIYCMGPEADIMKMIARKLKLLKPNLRHILLRKKCGV